MSKKQRRNRIISMILLFTMLFTQLGLENFALQAATTYTTLYLVDNTAEQWVGNDNAVIELVDNTYGHDHYIMTKVNDTTWSAKVPSSTYNVTFNRLSPDQSTQWNSWSAGGRDNHNAYHVLGFEYGYWDGTAELEEGFHAGDVIYLDFYEFTDWGKSNALFYVNFTDASKEDNGGSDITINGADSDRYAPIFLSEEIEEDVFTYTVTEEEEGATELRFWRGNGDTLWNCSVTLSYKDYKAGNNCAKIQGWNDEGYVCPYVPRRHIPVIDTMELKVSGNQKVNRKLTIDLVLEGETDLLSLEDTVITIEKEMEDGNEVEDVGDDSEGDSGEETADTSFLLYDDSKTTWNHRELLFTEPGTYHITAVATDGTDEFTTDTYITVVKDEAPVADFDFDCEDGNIYLRDENGTAKVTVTDISVCELGDTITQRVYKLYHDANADGFFGEEELIDTKEGNDLSFSYDLTSVGNYMVTLFVQETFEDTIPELLDESAYLSDDTTDKEESRVVFEITNQAPVSSMSMEKSKIADIVFTVGNAEEETLKQYTAATQKVEEQLKELGIDAKVSTVSTSALTAQDTFAWKEYDHYNFVDERLPTLEKHILYKENDIQMVGYSQMPMKDFLFIEDYDDSVKIFEFDLQKDNTNWHSMEGGGFLFNTKVSEEENVIQGYCVLVTPSGLSLIQIGPANLQKLRDGNYWRVEYAGKFLRSFPMNTVYGEHRLKIRVDKNTLTVYDGDILLIDEYVLPDDGVEAYGYGPITSHYAHNCTQQSYFTFKNITMQTITGETLSDVVNSHEWTPGTNHYVINLSESSVPELSDNDRMADVAAAMIANDAMFFGIGNDVTINQYNSLLNSMEGMGENIQLSYASGGETEDSSYQVNVDEAVDQIVARIVADIRGKDYSIGYTLTTDEEVVYTGTYSDPEHDPVGSEEWTYVYDASVFGEIQGEIKTLVQETPITMFAESGAYEISHRVSDDPAGDNEALDSYSQWSDTDEYKKLILSQHRPVATITVDTMQDENDSSKCLVNVVYESEDPDHPTDSKKGIREEKFYYKELGDTQWTEGRFPTRVEMGSTYLIKYIVTDMEGTLSRPAVAAVKTSEARTYVEPVDTNPPEVNLTVSKTLLQTGESFYVEASAMDDYGVTDFSIQVNGEDFRTAYGRYEYVPTEAGVYVVTATAKDIGGSETTESITVNVINNSDVTPPEITITSQTSGAIAGNIMITGSITDNKELKSYTVTRSKVNTSNEETGDSETDNTGAAEDTKSSENTGEVKNNTETGSEGTSTPETESETETTEESVVIASGTKEIINSTIAEIETSSLENGVYQIEILAEDTAGLTSSVSLIFTVNRKTIDRIPPQAVIGILSRKSTN